MSRMGSLRSSLKEKAAKVPPGERYGEMLITAMRKGTG